MKYTRPKILLIFKSAINLLLDYISYYNVNDFTFVIIIFWKHMKIAAEAWTLLNMSE